LSRIPPKGVEPFSREEIELCLPLFFHKMESKMYLWCQ
jgi:hypothetical protein